MYLEYDVRIVTGNILFFPNSVLYIAPKGCVGLCYLSSHMNSTTPGNIRKSSEICGNGPKRAKKSSDSLGVCRRLDQAVETG